MSSQCWPVTVVACALVFGCAASFAKGGGHSAGGHRSGAHSASAAPTHVPVHTSSRAAPGVARDTHGKIARSVKSKDEFKKAHPCPSTGRTSGACPGYVIDHVQALKHGGADAPTNMQWQTKAEAKAKDRTE